MKRCLLHILSNVSALSQFRVESKLPSPADFVSNLQTIEMPTKEEMLSPVLSFFCSLADLMIYISGALGILAVVLAGIKWLSSSDDPGARKQAKQIIVAVFIGLILVLLAKSIVELLLANLISEELTEVCK